MSAHFDVMAVMEEAPSVSVAGVTVLHNSLGWRVCTNRHSNTDGTSWGWIEGAPGNVCWSGNKKFNRAAAEEMVMAHAQWLEDQKPLSIKLVEARQRYAKAKATHDSAHKAYSSALESLKEAENVLTALAKLSRGESNG